MSAHSQGAPWAQRFGVLLTALVMFASACGGGGGGTADETGTGAAGPTTDGTANGETVKIGVVAGFSGASATVSRMWDLGVRKAVEEINAQGGILGRQVEVFSEDTRSEPPTSVTAMERALEENPIAIMGSVFSSSTIVNMKTVGKAGVPQFTGSTSSAITLEEKPEHLFRGEPNNEAEAQMFQTWMADEAQVDSLAFVFVNNEFGADGRDAFVPLIEEAGIEVVEEIATEFGQADFTGELARVQRSGAEGVFIYVHEEEAGRLLQQAAEQGMKDTHRFLGVTTLLTQSTIDLAGGAADGLTGFVPYTYAASNPKARELGEEFETQHDGELPDHNFYKGYISMWAAAYGYEDVGELDRAALIDYMHDRTFCVGEYPNLLGSAHWDELGDLDRSTFIVSVKDARQVLESVIPPLNQEAFSECDSMTGE